MSISAELAAKLKRMSEADLRAAMRRADQMAEAIVAGNASEEVKYAAMHLANCITDAANNIIRERAN